MLPLLSAATRHQHTSGKNSQPTIMTEEAAARGAPPLLPDEIIIWEILVNLDPRTLFRCRAVRRSWRHATSTRCFLLAHHARQPALPIFPGDGPGIQYRNILAFDHRATTDNQLHTVAQFDKDFDLEASCDGLLVLSKYERATSSRTFSVCNPATREHAYLRLPPWNFKTLAMYPHRPTGEYRLLLQQRIYTGTPKDQDCCYIYGLGSGQPPRYIEWLEMLGAYLNVPVRVHHSLHWYPKFYPSGSKRVIIVFDTVAESFRTMCAPILPAKSYIFDMDGTLAINSQSNATEYIDIRVLQNYETEVWELKYRIELPVVEIREKFDGCHWNVDVVSVDGGMLLLVSGYGWLLHVNCDGKLIASFRRGQSFCCMPGARLKHSLTHHSFFPALESYAMNASPFI